MSIDRSAAPGVIAIKRTDNPMRPLMYAIRMNIKYAEWRIAVLKRDYPAYPKMPKNIQVHHIRKLDSILAENNVSTLEEALRCKELWDLDNGIVLTKGEHDIIGRLDRHTKNISKGFVALLSEWLRKNDRSIGVS